MSTVSRSTKTPSSEQARHDRREKTKSASAYGQPSRSNTSDPRATLQDASAGAAQGARKPRPGFSRAYSAPLGARGQLTGLESRYQKVRIGDDQPDSPSDEEQQDIADDPFFQRFTAPQPLGGPSIDPPTASARQATDEHDEDEQDDEDEDEEEDEEDDEEDEEDSSIEGGYVTELPLSPISNPPNLQTGHRSAKGSPLSPQSANWPDQDTRMQEINIAVIGSPMVGKSTFVQRAFDLRTAAPSPFAQRKMSIDGNVYVVRLIELKYGDLGIGDDKRICWPTVIKDVAVPTIDGAFVLYDVTNKGSTSQLPDALSAIYNASTPLILVSCKCDVPSLKRALDPVQVDQRAKALIGDLTAYQTSYTVPDSQKRCIAVMLRAIVSVRNQSRAAATRRRANTTTIRNNGRGTASSNHSRANSETIAAMLHNRPGQQDAPPPIPSPKSYSSHHLPSVPSRYGRHDFDRTPEAYQAEGDDGILAAVQEPPPAYASAAGVISGDTGTTVAELVDRLLSQPLSKTDNKFVEVFLALYRVFCAPYQLLSMITLRFDAVDLGDSPQLVKAQLQLRDLVIMQQWISMYPGDFAHPSTRRKLEIFVNELAPLRLFAAAAKALTENLAVVIEDDDTDWAFCDRTLASTQRLSGGSDKVGVAITGDGTPPHTPAARIGTSPPNAASSQILLNIVESAQKQARQLVYRPKGPLTKEKWRFFLEIPDDTVAKELTRVDWIMFSSIRPRDFIRHVTLSQTARNKCKALENVQRMIDQFNHVAVWVTNFVLFRDKPKHRALMLEKFMRVARELRRLNNYNALGAVVAGINSTALHRLQASKDLLPPAVAKDFMKLEILMSPQKSYSAYRLAWDNTPGERIPYVPLHRRDLVSASEGNKTFVGVDKDVMEERWSQGTPPSDFRINWRKFEIMGEVVVSMQRAQAAPYSHTQLGMFDELRALMFETEVVRDEDKLYERSCAIEPGAGTSGTASGGKKRFQFFQGGTLASAFGSGSVP